MVARTPLVHYERSANELGQIYGHLTTIYSVRTCVSKLIQVLMYQVADTLERHLQERLPPSRRIMNSQTAADPAKESITRNLKTPPGASDINDEIMSEKRKSLTDLHAGSFTSSQAAALDTTSVVANMEDDIASLNITIIDDVVNLHEAEKKRSEFAQAVGETGRAAGEVKVDVNHEKRYGKSTAKKIASGDIVLEDGKLYDMSLLRAIISTVWFEWCLSALLNAIAGKCKIKLYHSVICKCRRSGK